LPEDFLLRSIDTNTHGQRILSNLTEISPFK
jgi:hypothetical protein